MRCLLTEFKSVAVMHFTHINASTWFQKILFKYFESLGGKKLAFSRATIVYSANNNQLC